MKSERLLALFAISIAISASAQVSTPHRFYQTALLEMEAKGDYEHAITLFNKILDSKTNDRGLLAKVYLQRGVCYEKLGNKGAMSSYEVVITRYSDQRDVANEARSRIEKLKRKLSANHGSSIFIRNIDDSRTFGQFSFPSPDGTKIIYRKVSPNKKTSLWLCNLTSGEHHELMEYGDEYFLPCVTWSLDGKQIVYSSAYANGSCGLVLFTFASRDVDTLLALKNEYILPADWSRDQRSLLVVRRDSNSVVSVGTFSIRDRIYRDISGKYRDVIQMKDYWTPKLSPDGKYYVSLVGVGSKSQIKIFGIDNSSESQLTDTIRNTKYPCWTSDGEAILFLHEREGNCDLLRMEVRNGQPVSAPNIVKSELGARVKIIGLTTDDKLYYSLLNRWQSIVTVEVDPRTGKANSKPVHLVEYGVNNTQPYWSPSGSSVFYLSIRGMSPASGSKTPRQFMVTSKNMNTPAQVIDQQGYVPYIFIVSPDSDFVFFDGWNPDGTRGLFALSLVDNSIQMVIADSLLNCLNHPMRITGWNQKQQRLIFQCANDTVGSDISRVAVYGIDLTRKQLEYLTECNGSGTTLSPDGNEIVYVNRIKKTLEIKSFIRDTAWVILRYENPIRDISWPTWSPDGSKILYVVYSHGGNSELRCVPSTGGGSYTSFAGSQEFPVLWSPRWSPDGKNVAFSAFLGGEYDLWVLENFLPKK